MNDSGSSIRVELLAESLIALHHLAENAEETKRANKNLVVLYLPSSIFDACEGGIPNAIEACWIPSPGAIFSYSP